MAPQDSRNRSANEEPATVKTPMEARAGLISGHVITILIVGTVLAVVLLGVVWVVSGG